MKKLNDTVTSDTNSSICFAACFIYNFDSQLSIILLIFSSSIGHDWWLCSKQTQNSSTNEEQIFFVDPIQPIPVVSANWSPHSAAVFTQSLLITLTHALIFYTAPSFSGNCSQFQLLRGNGSVQLGQLPVCCRTHCWLKLIKVVKSKLIVPRNMHLSTHIYSFTRTLG